MRVSEIVGYNKLSLTGRRYNHRSKNDSPFSRFEGVNEHDTGHIDEVTVWVRCRPGSFFSLYANNGQSTDLLRRLYSAPCCRLSEELNADQNRRPPGRVWVGVYDSGFQERRCA